MATANPFPILIPQKVNSPELLAFFQQFGIDKYLSATEINTIVQGLSYLYENMNGGALSESGITTLGTISIDGDEVTFTGFAWKISGTNYAQAAPITRTLPLASEGMYRTHTAYFTTTNDIQIAVGDESSEVTTEPNIPEGTLRMRAFNVFGETITVGPGEALPYDINLLDLLMQNPAPGDFLLINVGGIDYRVDFQRFITMFGGSALTLSQVLTNGNVMDKDIQVESSNLRKIFSGRLQVLFDPNTQSLYVADINPDTEMFETGFEIREGTLIMQSGIENITNNEVLMSPSVFELQKKTFFEEGIYNQILRFRSPSSQIGTGIVNARFLFPFKGNGDYTLATTQDIDDALEGLKTKQPVRVATTTNISLNGLIEVDGIWLSQDNRVLVKDQTNQWLNGIYLAKDGDWVRADDANTATELTNALVSVLEGTANAGSTFRQITTSITLGTSNIVWQSFGAQTPDATSTTKGKAKLYNELGTNTDGAVTQNVVKTVNDSLVLELARKANNLVLYNRTAWFAQRGSSGFGTIGITPANFVFSGASSVTPSATNGYTPQVRLKFSTGTTPGSLAYYRIGTDPVIINTRFTFNGLFAFEGTTSDTRFANGLTTATSANPTNVAPTSLTNVLLVSKIATSNNLHVIHNDNSGTASTIDLGANFPCDTNSTDSTYFEFNVFTVGVVIYKVFRINSDGVVTHVAEGTITSDLPTDNTLLYHRAWITNNASSADSSFAIMGGSLGKN